jgi:anti-sigma B factor antagonist
MNVPIETIQGRLVVTLPTDVDASVVPQIEAALEPHVSGPAVHVVMDFSQVQYIDSSGIGTIVRMFRGLKEKGGTMVLAGCSDSVTKVFTLINFQKYFQFFATREEAIQAPKP